MEEAPWGERRTEDEQLLTHPSTDRAITPDRVSPAIEGYFRFPAVWIGAAPDPPLVRALNPAVHHQIVLTRSLRCGIEVRVQRDGSFWFDFTSWPLAPQVVIPGFRRPDPDKACRVPRFHQEAEELAEAYAVVRARVMNTHQACLISSEMVVRSRGAGMGFPVTSWSTEKGISWSALRTYYDATENAHALARNALNNSYGVRRAEPLHRRVLELDVVEHSLSKLDEILLQQNGDLLQLVETLYMSASRNQEKRFGEALLLAWSVCEQIVSLLWATYLRNSNDPAGAARFPKERRDRLGGRDYTASVVLEILEMVGELDRESYRRLDVCRRARNRWAHQLKSPKESESSLCIRTAQALLRRVFSIELHLQYGGAGGVPQWPVWIWKEVEQAER